MIAITVIKPKSDLTINVLNKFFSIVEDNICFLLIPIIYEEEAGYIRNTVFINDECTHAEIYTTWDTEEQFTAWINNKEIQTLRKDFEPGLFKQLRESLEITRYLSWDDTAVDPECKKMIDYTPSDYIMPI